MTVRIAWRSLWRHRRRTLITIASIGLGLGLVILFVSLAEGTYTRLVEDAVRMQAGHVTVEHADYRDAPEVHLRIAGVGAMRAAIEALPEVESTKLLVLGQGLVRSSAGAVGVAVMGVEPEVEVTTSPLARRLVAGRYLDAGDVPRVVVGRVLAERLGLAPGRKLVLATNDASGAMVEALFRVEGVFETGAEEVDGYLLQAPIAPVRRLYGLGADEATALGVVLRDPDTLERAVRDVRRIVTTPSAAVRPWQEVLPEVAAFIRLDRTSDGTYQGILLFLVLCTIFNTILMSVLERTREFAVLLAIGTAPGQLAGQLVLESAFLGLLGCGAGLLLGGGLAWLVQVYGIDLTRFYEHGMTISGFALSTRLHARPTLHILATLAGLVFSATILVSLWPARRATQVDLAEVLR